MWLNRVAESKFKRSSRRPTREVWGEAIVTDKNSISSIVKYITYGKAHLVLTLFAESLHEVQVQAVERNFIDIRVICNTYYVEFLTLYIVEKAALPALLWAVVIQANIYHVGALSLHRT